MVSVLTFYSDDPSSNPADAYSFSVQIVFEKNENKQKKRPGLAHLKKIKLVFFIRAILYNSRCTLICKLHTMLDEH